MAPSKKKVAQPKEVSLETPPQTGLPNIELQKDENKLFDEDDKLIKFTISDFSIASEEEKKTPITTVWDHAVETLFKLSSVHPDSNSLQMWIKYQNIDSMEQFFPWDE